MTVSQHLVRAFEADMRRALGPLTADGRVWIRSVVLIDDGPDAQVVAWIQGRFAASGSSLHAIARSAALPEDRYYIVDREHDHWRWTPVGPEVTSLFTQLLVPGWHVLE
jgi:hypothetical protein